MNNSSYFRYVLNCFLTLDIEKLNLVLKDEYTYQDTTKEIFLSEIASIFEAHRFSGDTSLLQYSGHCMATCSECDGCGKKGYRLVGNKSGNYTDLIFDVEADEIKDIFHCSKFTSDQEVKDLASQSFIHINLDDKVTFKKTTEYWVKLNAAINAIDEIVTSPPRLISFEELSYWVEKNTLVYNRIGRDSVFGPAMKWTPFIMLFGELNQMKNFLEKNTKLLTEANYKSSKHKNDEEIIDWLFEYEIHFKKGIYDFGYGFQSEEDYFVLDNKYKIHFQGNEFSNAVLFFEFYDNQYDLMLNKYSTYSLQESIEVFNNYEVQQKMIDITSLRFHMAKRKTLENIGLTIPFYIVKTNYTLNDKVL